MTVRGKKPRICLIYMGGTIGMQKDSASGALRPSEDPKAILKIVPELGETTDFEFVELMNKDSSNITPADWTAIAQNIYSRRNDGFDGFVIVHGTDTMHFSASAVALALGGNLNFPVVFTGAQTPYSIQHGDARTNLLRAFKAAASDIAEVAICFGDYVFRGCRALKKDERRFDAFASPAYPPLAFITEEIVVSGAAKKREDKTGEIDFKPNFAAGIFQTSLIPGLEPEFLYKLLKSGAGCRGIVLQSFGAGNVPNKGAYSLIDFIEKSTESGIPVLITSQFPANSALSNYETGTDAVNAGAIHTGNMTAACASAKFRWALAQVEKIDGGAKRFAELRRIMDTPYIGEMDSEVTLKR
ncbi:L-asparaginase [Fibrobacteres bacterium R8-0-B4]